jgi:putative membrane protein
MAEDKTEKRASSAMKFSFRVFINLAVIYFLHTYFNSFFILTGGLQTIAIVGLTLTFLNWLVVPILRVLSLPIKFMAWAIAFLVVNAAAVWLTVSFVASLNIPGVSLTIGGGVVGWILVSMFFGAGNWMVKAIVK